MEMPVVGSGNGEGLHPSIIKSGWFQSSELISCDAFAHLRYMEELFSVISYKSAPQRLLRFLDWLGDRFGCQVDQGRIIDLGLTHQMLAEITGITRGMATRSLNEFEREGQLLRLPKQHILLPFRTSKPERVASIVRH